MRKWIHEKEERKSKYMTKRREREEVYDKEEREDIYVRKKREEGKIWQRGERKWEMKDVNEKKERGKKIEGVWKFDACSEEEKRNKYVKKRREKRIMWERGKRKRRERRDKMKDGNKEKKIKNWLIWKFDASSEGVKVNMCKRRERK